MISAFSSWHFPPQNLTFEVNKIHVWRIFLAEAASCLQRFQQTLSHDELTKAERFHFQKDRTQFMVSRGALRAILSQYVDINPRALRFEYNPYGKPSLIVEQGGNTLRFNLSHSHGIALIAITKNRDIGVDIERIDTNFPYQQIAERVFSPLENAVLRSLPEQIQLKAFFTCWTRKEAYIKAVGKGLSIPLDCFDVTLAPGEPPALLNFQEKPEEASRWSLIELIPSPDTVATVAVEGYYTAIECWQWPGDAILVSR
ncbi:MAG: 4'-phosphopantetheinyl transferase superfamily protein [Microcoleus sp. CSU_2_2]|nr:4'-phosphopantetheinyl transferase superfamily protein [Microcoleus sp. SU_5_3]NJS12631.1 4'-phosphopantetheinyl transferase superfamily protein [Microcoleus sp. CSU_2_2]